MKTDIYTQVLFGQLNPHYPVWKAFRKLFPTLAREIIKRKQGSWNAFPLDLQKREADIMIGRVVPILADIFPGVHLLTVHDSVAIPRPYAEAAATIIKQEFARAVGFEPAVKIGEAS